MNYLHFDNPEILIGLWILPGVAWLFYWSWRRRQSAAKRFATDRMNRRLMPHENGGRRLAQATLLLLALGLIIVAGARPRFGKYFEEVTSRGADVFVLLDVSKSMNCEDVAPSRLERAKADIQDLLLQLQTDRVGLVAFAGKPVVKVPLTSDQNYYRMILDEVDSTSAPMGGTLIGDGIRRCLTAFPEQEGRDQAIVLITDGEDHESVPLEAAKLAAERGVKIFTIGLGDDKEGARIPVRDEEGKLSYLKHEGQEPWSKTNHTLLKEIAATTRGAHIPAGTKVYDLGEFYSNHLAELARAEGTDRTTREKYHEQFQVFLLLGILGLMAAASIKPYSRRKRTEIIPLVENKQEKKETQPV